MKRSIKLILIAIVFLLLIVTGWALFKINDSSLGNAPNFIQEASYCELDTETLTCTPEDKCKLYEAEDRVKWCMSK